MPRKITIEELPEGWYETIVSLGSQGKTQLSIHKALGISQSLFERLRDEEPEFKQAVKEFRMESSLFWTDLARAYALGDPDVINQFSNFNALKYNILNRPHIGWTDKQVVEQETVVTVSDTATDLFQKMMNADKK
jgi:hypothetical protein